LCSRRRPNRQNSDKLNFPGGTEEIAAGQIMKPLNGCFDLDLFRREIEPMARRLIQLCEPDWFSNLL